MTDKARIDELLSSYLDGEMTERQLTEVKRLIANDEELGARLMEMQRQRELLASMPIEQAPAKMLLSIRSSLERKMLLQESSRGKYRWRASIFLAMRKAVAVAAVLLLVAGLGLLVAMVLGPGESDDMPPQLGPQAGPLVAPPAPVARDFAAELNIISDVPMAVNSAISKAVEKLGLWDVTTIDRQSMQSGYLVQCAAADAVALVEELLPIWDKMGSVKFALSGQDGTAVDAASGLQVVSLLKIDARGERLATARDYAFLNNVAGKMPGGEMLIPDGDGPLWVAPRPVLVSPDAENASMPSRRGGEVQVTLTIVVSAMQ